MCVCLCGGGVLWCLGVCLCGGYCRVCRPWPNSQNETPLVPRGASLSCPAQGLPGPPSRAVAPQASREGWGRCRGGARRSRGSQEHPEG